LTVLSDVFIGIGSNMENPLDNCIRATDILHNSPQIKSLKLACWYKTQPFGNIQQNWFINSVIQISTTLEPFKLLELCQNIENRMNRKRDIHWGPRTLDLDILLWGTYVCYSRNLILPHPGVHLRRFVLQPLCDLAPNILHPLLGKTAQNLLSSLSDSLEVIQLN